MSICSTVKAKLVLMVALFVTLLLIISTVSLIAAKAIQTELHQVTENDIPLTKKISHILEGQAESAIQLERIMVSYLENNALPVEYVAKFDSFVSKERLELTDAESFVDAMAAKDLKGIEAEMVLSLQPKIHEIAKQFDLYVEHANHMLDVLDRDGFQAAKDQLHQVEDEGQHLTEQLGQFLFSVEDMTEHALLAVEEHEKSLIKTLLILSVFTVGFGFTSGVILVRSILNPLGAEPSILSTVSTRIAEGDLREHECDLEDQKGVYQSIISMSTNLRGMVLDITQASAEVSTNAEQAAAMNEVSNTAVKGQRDETGMVATAVQEMASTVQEIASSANLTAESTRELLSSTQAGAETVNQAVGAMNSLVEDINQTNTHIEDLKENAQAIGTVLEVIQGIAEQTNLLALNAAIEAARAGDQGRGFAVVADEVRSLAQRTQASTEEIDQMIEKIQTGTEVSVESMQKSVASVNDAVGLVEQSGDCLRETNTGMNHINDMNTQVAAAAEEQASVVEEISRNIESINNLTMETTEASHGSKEAVDRLVHLANSLKTSVNRFVV